MPLTPFHLGPALFLGTITLNLLNLWAVILGSIVADLEPLILAISRHCYRCPHHGFFHSILGAVAGSFILSILIFIFKERLNGISLKLKISQTFSFPVLFFSSFAAWTVHVFFDSLANYDVFPLWPSRYNPLLQKGDIYMSVVYFLSILGIFSLFLIYIKIKNNKFK